MTPHKYTQKEDGDIIFHHKYKEIKDFLEHGFREGNNGWLLMGREKNFSIFKGFGTIEAPYKHLRKISVEHDPLWDGEIASPEEVINPPKEEYSSMTTKYSLLIWDARENKTI